MSHGIDNQKRWLALVLLCLGELMIVLDSTIVNVALPSIRSDLNFSETGLVWVVNAFLLTFGGFLLLGGRLGDLYGHRRIFLSGIVVFTLASVCCGLANSQLLLITARAVQGVGGAIVSAVALSLIMNLFPETGARARAMGVYGFVCAGGGSIGVLLGGLLTGTLSWHWIFLVNLPLGVAVYVACAMLIPRAKATGQRSSLDVGGAITITTSLLLAVYAIVDGNQAGWLSARTVGLLLAALLLFVAFLCIEQRVVAPLMPMRIFRLHNVVFANIVSVLWAAAMFAWFFMSAFYLQQILRYTPMQVGLAFLPSNIIMAIFSLGISARLVMRFGIRPPLVTGLLVAAAGLLLFARAPMAGEFLTDVLPAMVLLGLGAGIAFNPILLAAMNNVEPEESGLASGIVNTAFMMGGALGLAILASVAAARTGFLQAAGKEMLESLHGGYQYAFLAGGICAIFSAVLAALFLKGELADPAAAARH